MRFSKQGQTVQNSVHTFRKNKGMTQQELARALGVTRQTVISIEKGKYLPSLPLALQIAKTFNAQVEDIFTL